MNLNTAGTYSSSSSYYTVTGSNPATVTRVYPAVISTIGYYSSGVSAGYFKRVTSGSNNIYSSTGEKLSSCSGTCYQLMQYSDGNIDLNATYFYLVTRDTNIYVPSETGDIRTTYITTTKPMTITGINNGVDNSNNRRIRIYEDWTIGADLRIEYIRFYESGLTTTTVDALTTSNYEIIGNYHNLKLGRGIKKYNSNLTAGSFIGGSSSATSGLQKYTTIVESGFYQAGSGVGYSSAVDHHVNAYVTLGNDVDRAKNDNNQFIVHYSYAGSWASNLYNSTGSSNTYNTPAIFTTVKSGSFGTNQADYGAGVYVGGRGSGAHYALREIVVEGGYIFNLIGGPISASGRAGKNDVILNVKGGTINMVFGGAGVSNSVGNRILNVTGGTIQYSVLGGSNAYNLGNNNSNPYGKIDGDTLVYVGGNVTVGNKTDSIYNVTSGNVFGAGNGRSAELDVGSVNNSHVIIDTGATIKGDVYGGGNFGAVGGSTAGNPLPVPGEEYGVYEDSTADQNIRYFGSNPNNYIRFNNETYRIVGLFNNVSTSDGNKNLVRIIKTSSAATRAWGDSSSSTSATNTSSTGSTGFLQSKYNYTNYYKNYYNYFVKSDNTKSSMYTYLNTTYYGTINSTYQNYIQSVNWGLGAANSNGLSAGSFYTSERGTGTVSYQTGTGQTSNGTSLSSANFKIGLFYPSDYGFANRTNSCMTNLGSYSTTCRNDNWLNYISNAWSMTPATSRNDVTKEYQVSRSGNLFSGYTYTMRRYYHHVHQNFIIGSTAIDLRDIYYTGNDNDANNYYNTNAVYPSFYLKEDVSISSGSGTSSDPYVIGNGDETLAEMIYQMVHPNTGSGDGVLEDDGVYVDPNDYQAKTRVHILGGTIQGSVYGAGNSNGAGNATNGDFALAKVQIDIDGGTISQSVYGGSNAKGHVYGDTLLNINNGTINGPVYGGGKGGYSSASSPGTYVSRNVDVNIGSGSTTSLTIAHNVYGGSAFGTVNGIAQGESANSNYVRVKVNKGVVNGSVFGGGEGNSTYQPKEYGNIFVHVNGGNVSNVYGGNDSSGAPSAGVVGNAFGGGNNTGQPKTDIRLQGSTISGNLYGGSNASGNVPNTRVQIISGSAVEVFGGNNLGGSVDSSSVRVTGGTVSSAVYGGGKQATCTTTDVRVSCTTSNVYGGGKNAGVTNGTNVTLTGASATSVFGGSNVTGNVPISHVQVTNSSIGSLYGGNNAGGSTTDTNIETTNSTITNLFGGGDNASSSISHITINSGSVSYLYGGGNEAGVTTTNVSILGGSVSHGFGGSNRAGNINNSYITVSAGTHGELFGGNKSGGSTTNTHITATGGSFTTIYGGGDEANANTTSLVLDSITATNVYGGGNNAAVSLTTNVDLDDSTISGSVFGGGKNGLVGTNTSLYITDCEVNGNVYAGGDGSSAVVKGNSTVTIDGETVVGTNSTTAPNGGCVFGSGNAASTGERGSSGVATVNIVGGEFYGNIYGGPKMAVVYGTTDTNIGTSAVSVPNLHESDILIHGTVFGGGESNASGSENYDYTFISVTDGIDVTIDGTGYDNHNHSFVINGSIFGSGNASSSSGASNIAIKNLGSMSQPNQAISIQRANNVVVDSSVVELFGTTDRTNEYSDILYSFNLIDKLVIKNGTTLLLHHNANMLKELYSGLDYNGQLVKAAVTIHDDTKTVERNVDNRIYMIPGQNLNIAVNAAANAYGRVNGMTFFGMYTVNNQNYRFGLYDSSYDYDDSGSTSLEIIGGSYVMGLRNTNHDITKDGFYTNSLDETTHTKIVTAYIDPTPIGETGYRWLVGFESIEYEVDLMVSKYSSFGTQELSLVDFANGDTLFYVDSVDTSGLASDISLIDSNSIPRIASSEAAANQMLGLSFKAETQEWTGTGVTKFLGANGGTITGERNYSTDSRSLVPSLMFYSYHPKNYTRTGDLGEVIITLEVSIPKNAIEYEIKYVTITVSITARDFGNEQFYDASISYAKKYEMPAATSVNITNQSQLTAYFSLTEYFNEFKDVYAVDNSNYHALTFSESLPVDTMITMLDFGSNPNRPDYYYYRVTQADYTRTQQEIISDGQASYRLSNFIKMDSTSSNNTYDDATANLLYYDSQTDLVVEEFIFIIDFKDTSRSGTHLNTHVSFELRDKDDWDVINVVSIRDALMNFSTFDSSNVTLRQDIVNADTYLYYGVFDELQYSTNVLYDETENRQPVIDTNYESSSMGLNVTFYDRTGKQVSSSLLVGTSITIANREYFADGEGVFRIKLSNKVSNLTRDTKLFIAKKLPAGNYRIRYTLFASEDGLHNSTYHNSVSQDINVVVVSAENYISVDCDDATKLIYGETGVNHSGSILNAYTIYYHADLENPNFRVKISKRTIDDVDSTTYEPFAFNRLFNTGYTTSNDTAYLTVTESGQTFNFRIAENLTSGTYRVAFQLYDNNQLVDEDIKNVIVQKQ